MVMFLERFKKRIMEVATLDMNDQVRLAGLNLVSVIIDHNIFDSDSISSLRGLIFDEHLKVRESVALIIKGVLEQGSIKNLVSIADSCGLPKTEIKKRAILKGLSSYVAESEGSWLNAKLFYDAMNAHFPILAVSHWKLSNFRRDFHSDISYRTLNIYLNSLLLMSRLVRRLCNLQIMRS